MTTNTDAIETLRESASRLRTDIRDIKVRLEELAFRAERHGMNTDDARAALEAAAPAKEEEE